MHGQYNGKSINEDESIEASTEEPVKEYWQSLVLKLGLK